MIMTERERFEAWATKNKMDVSCFDGFYGDRDTFMAWQAWQARCPEGYSVVPNELIDWVRGAQELMRDMPGDWLLDANQADMLLAAAPKPGEE